MGAGSGDVKSVIGTCCNSIFATIVIGISMAIPISMIAMGAIHQDDCPAEDMIAIYLIVMGAVTLLRSVISLGLRVKNRDEEGATVNPLTCIIDLFLFAWFIAGCVYIYRSKDEIQSHDTKSDDYCDYTFYWYSFWITTSSFIILGAVLVISCVVVCCSVACR